jgi:DNA polymerase-3 subunit delta
MKFSEFRHYQPKHLQHVFAFVCEDAFLVEESRDIWRGIFGGEWVFEKYSTREFEEIPAARLMDEALTPSLFSQNRALLVAADKLSRERLDDLQAIRTLRDSSLKIVLTFPSRKSADTLAKGLPLIEIDVMKPAETARWLMDKYKLSSDAARYLVDHVGTDLYTLHCEIEKLRTYVGRDRQIETRDIDMLVLRSEEFAPFELDDAIVGRNYGRAVNVVASMLEGGDDFPIVLSRIARVWRQLFIGKGLGGRSSAKDVAMAAGVPAFKAGDFTAACKKFEWDRLASGFRELLDADRAFKTWSANPRVFFDVLLWKLIR